MAARPIVVAACGLLVALVGCGSDTPARPAALPSSGKAYRALADDDRTVVAESCRDRAARAATGTAAAQLHAVDSEALREQLDDAFRIIPVQRRSVAGVCAERLPFVTPGLEVGFAGAEDDGDGSFSYQTTSDKLLTISGRVTPAPSGGRVVLRRNTGAPLPEAAALRRDGSFVIADLRLRKLADNSFTLTIEAAPNAPRKVQLSAICLDCLAGAPPPAPVQ
jgi:hypothetical protein